MDSSPPMSTTDSLASASNVLNITNDLDTDSSLGNMFPKHSLGLLNVQDLHLLATANLIAQTQETIAQQYNISVGLKTEKQPKSESRSPQNLLINGPRLPETNVKRTASKSKLEEKVKRLCTEQVNIAGRKARSANGNNTQPPAEYFCSHCKDTFNTAAELKTHHKLHNTMVCQHPGCNRKFTWPAHYKYHQLTHVGEKNFVCDFEGCGNVFYTAQHLDVHKRTHNNSKPFSCADCPKSFTTVGNLKNHRRCHTGEKPFACDYPDCDKRFAELSTLKKHKITHTGKKPFECEICHKSFTQSSSRKTHMKTHHGEGHSRRDNNKGESPREIINSVPSTSSANVTTDSGRPVVELKTRGEERVVSEEALEAHIKDVVTDPSSSICIVVIPPDHENG